MTGTMPTDTTVFERHFSTNTLAELWSVSPETITRWFEDLPGVVKYGNKGGRGKRRYITLKIPESIANSVYAERTR